MRRKNVKVLREDVIYPGTPAYVIEIISHDIGGSYTYEASVPKTEFDLQDHLNKMVDSGKVSEKEMQVLEALIEEYGDGKYREASDAADMEAAGASI